jgi:hypothetical protein
MRNPFYIRKKILFLMVFVYMLIFIGLTVWFFRDDRPSDGPFSLGIPLPFYYGGGYCG